MSVLFEHFASQPGLREPRPVTYAWDQWAYTDYFYFTTPDLLARAGQLTGTACRALCIGLGEWMAARLRRAARINDARAYLDAAWATMLVHNACDYAELAHDDWAGPLDGALRAAMLVVNDTLFEAEEDRKFADRVCWQVHLAHYVADDEDRLSLDAWLDRAWSALELRHKGPVASYRSIFDPAFSYGQPVAPDELLPTAKLTDRDAETALVRHVNAQIGRNSYLRLARPLSPS